MKITKDSLIKKIINKETIAQIRAINEHFEKIEPWKYEKYADSKFYVKDLAKIGENCSARCTPYYCHRSRSF